jgi:hypothetical protein
MWRRVREHSHFHFPAPSLPPAMATTVTQRYVIECVPTACPGPCAALPPSHASLQTKPSLPSPLISPLAGTSPRRSSPSASPPTASSSPSAAMTVSSGCVAGAHGRRGACCARARACTANFLPNRQRGFNRGARIPPHVSTRARAGPARRAGPRSETFAYLPDPRPAAQVYNGKSGGLLHSLKAPPKPRAPPPTPAPGSRSSPSKQAAVDIGGDSLEDPGLPITALRFRPPSVASQTRNVLLACGADGAARHWHVASGRLLSATYEPDNQIFAADYRSDGLAFATGGKDKAVRVYDESRATGGGDGATSVGASAATTSSSSGPTLTMRGGGSYSSASVGEDGSANAGHSNRIFAVTWHPTDPFTVVSGGWDNTIQVYDTRVGHSVRSLYGAHICGDALALSPDGSTLLTGSWRPDDCLQLWDFASGKLLVSVPWVRGNRDVPSYLASVGHVAGISAGRKIVPSAPGSPPPPAPWSKPDPCMLYSASFSRAGQGASPAGTFVVAAGSGANGAKVFRTADLVTLAADIRATQEGGAAGSVGLGAAVSFTVTSPNGLPPRPLVASIDGLQRGVYASDWDGTTGLVLCGGDQPIRVFDLTQGPAAAAAAGGEGEGETAVSATPSSAPATPARKTTRAGGRARIAAAAAASATVAESAAQASSEGSAAAATAAAADVPPPASPDAGAGAAAAAEPPVPPPADAAAAAAEEEEGLAPAVADELAAVFGEANDDEDDDEEDEEGVIPSNEDGDSVDDDVGFFDAGHPTSPGGRPTSAGRLGAFGSPAIRRPSGAVDSFRAAIQTARAGPGAGAAVAAPALPPQQQGVARSEAIPGVTGEPADEAALLAQYGGADGASVGTASTADLEEEGGGAGAGAAKAAAAAEAPAPA